VGGTTTNFVKSSTLSSYPSLIKNKLSKKEINFAHHIAEFPRCLRSRGGSISVFGADNFFGSSSRAQFHVHEHAGSGPGSGSSEPSADALYVGSTAKCAAAYV
jgi:hypothetical protein